MLDLTVRVPEALESQGKQQLEALAQEALLVQLYRQGKIGSGFAAEALGISRRAFLELLGPYGVSTFDEDMDVAQEAAHG
ncbi:MAG: UPF0175 family protein [Chloroflexota bacterium]|nr:UPF0175 family protein [Chloroflexota bacterium]PLS83806.1 MAG: hypothetical protein CYG59_00050 [Chloroflexota bacterium]